jgi:small subunit ribosomal protein S8
MSMQDPVADMLTRVRNAQARKKKSVLVLYATLNLAILKVLQDEGYIKSYQSVENDFYILIKLKYGEDGQPAILKINRVSRPSRRVYAKIKDLGMVQGGMGVYILSTTKGVMTDHKARCAELHQGGEVLCELV